jgi:transmembrane sensor
VNDELERARAAEPTWDEVRERRVLQRVLGARETARAGGRSKARGFVIGLAAAAVIAVGLYAGRGVWTTEATPVTEAAPVVAERESAGRLELRDGSIVELGEGARVRVVTDEATDVRIAHEDGEARYVVSHVPTRTFTVACAEVEVVVRGTRFVVRRDGSLVDVDVEEGRVEVRRGGQSTLLVRGESLRVDGSVQAEAPSATSAPEEEMAEVSVAPAPRPARVAPAPTAPVSVDALLAEADTARREHRPEDAVRALHAAIDALGADRRAATPLFMLGRVERSRGRASAAADAFSSAYARDPDAVLAEDALAESVVSFAAAGRDDEAHESAARYEARYPTGHYAERVHAALD